MSKRRYGRIHNPAPHAHRSLYLSREERFERGRVVRPPAEVLARVNAPWADHGCEWRSTCQGLYHCLVRTGDELRTLASITSKGSEDQTKWLVALVNQNPWFGCVDDLFEAKMIAWKRVLERGLLGAMPVPSVETCDSSDRIQDAREAVSGSPQEPWADHGYEWLPGRSGCDTLIKLDAPGRAIAGATKYGWALSGTLAEAPAHGEAGSPEAAKLAAWNAAVDAGLVTLRQPETDPNAWRPATCLEDFKGATEAKATHFDGLSAGEFEVTPGGLCRRRDRGRVFKPTFKLYTWEVRGHREPAPDDLTDNIEPPRQLIDQNGVTTDVHGPFAEPLPNGWGWVKRCRSARHYASDLEVFFLDDDPPRWFVDLGFQGPLGHLYGTEDEPTPDGVTTVHAAIEAAESAYRAKHSHVPSDFKVGDRVRVSPFSSTDYASAIGVVEGTTNEEVRLSFAKRGVDWATWGNHSIKRGALELLP